ncbi:uncharacterized protein LY89DRAFT_720428 [Mollisia scopiformis]|uniref:Uncharacterized protein n=1 Tax=Mollisia scopiformis TaxID=149040 RepID=A0A194X4M0_MOLSC|nr:uncharacterized protein LY89DRAFT_720428 [Mollisia scopiformis]KUJ15014.1 hypothetical protein LY89DRAFT_720428 [Mollisia scopiformis]
MAQPLDNGVGRGDRDLAYYDRMVRQANIAFDGVMAEHEEFRRAVPANTTFGEMENMYERQAYAIAAARENVDVARDARQDFLAQRRRANDSEQAPPPNPEGDEDCQEQLRRSQERQRQLEGQIVALNQELDDEREQARLRRNQALAHERDDLEDNPEAQDNQDCEELLRTAQAERDQALSALADREAAQDNENQDPPPQNEDCEDRLARSLNERDRARSETDVARAERDVARAERNFAETLASAAREMRRAAPRVDYPTLLRQAQAETETLISRLGDRVRERDDARDEREVAQANVRDLELHLGRMVRETRDVVARDNPAQEDPVDQEDPSRQGDCEEQLEILRQELLRGEERLIVARTDLEARTEERDQAINERDAALDRAAEMAEEMNNLRLDFQTRLDVATGALDAALGERNQARIDLERLTQELADAAGVVAALEECIEERAVAQAEIDRLTLENEAFLRVGAEFGVQINEAQAEIDTLTQSLADAARVATDLNECVEERAIAQAEIDRLTRENEALVEGLVSEVQDNDTQAEIERLTQGLADANARVQELADEVVQIQQEREDCDDTLEDAKRKIKDLKKTGREATKDFEKCADRLERERQKVKDLKEADKKAKDDLEDCDEALELEKQKVKDLKKKKVVKAPKKGGRSTAPSPSESSNEALDRGGRRGGEKAAEVIPSISSDSESEPESTSGSDESYRPPGARKRKLVKQSGRGKAKRTRKA